MFLESDSTPGYHDPEVLLHENFDSKDGSADLVCEKAELDFPDPQSADMLPAPGAYSCASAARRVERRAAVYANRLHMQGSVPAGSASRRDHSTLSGGA